MVVMPDAGSFSEDVRVCLYLQGGVLTVPDVVHGVRHGPVLAYLPAISIRREIWLSDGFVGSFKALAAVVKHIASRDNSNWSLLGSAAEFETAKTDAFKKKRNATVLALVTKAERAAIASHTPAWLSRHAYTWHNFLAFVARADPTRWNNGFQ